MAFPDDRSFHYRAFIRAAMGLHELDHPTFAGLPRAWRAVFYPSFHDAVAITLSDLDVGGWIDYAAKVDGQLSAFSAWCPTPARAPLHYAYAVTLCQVAVHTIADPAAHAAVNALAPYLRG